MRASVTGAVSAVAGTLEEAGVKVRREGDALVWDELPTLAEFLTEPASKVVSNQGCDRVV